MAIAAICSAYLATGCGRKPCNESGESPLVRLDQSLDKCNWRPVARITGPVETSAGKLVELSAAMSTDRNGDPLDYTWSLVTKPDGSTAALDTTTGTEVEFTADLLGGYEVKLVVTDGDLLSEEIIWSVPALNHKPIARPGTNFEAALDSVVRLDGAASTDEDGDPITYLWSFDERPIGSAAEFDDPTAVAPSFPADAQGFFVVSLVVNDGELDSDPGIIRVAVEIPGSRPIADAGPDLDEVVEGTEIRLDGSRSFDADNDPLTFQWSLDAVPMGSTASVSEANARFARITPDVAGTYSLSLIVRDRFFESTPDVLTIEVDPDLEARSRFDPSQVYVFGLIRPGSRNGLMNLDRRGGLTIAFPGITEREFYVPLVVRPSDNRLVYQEPSHNYVYIFNADPWDPPRMAGGAPEYPAAPEMNDTPIVVPGCDEPDQFWIDPDTSEIIVECDGVFFDETGAEPFIEPNVVLHLGPAGSRLVRVGITPAVRTSTGTLHLHDGLIRFFKGYRSAPDGDGFILAARPDAMSVQNGRLVQLHLDGRLTQLGTYPDVPEELGPLDRTVLAPNGDMYMTVRELGAIDVHVIRRPLNGEAHEVVFVGDDESPLKLASGALWTGP